MTFQEKLLALLTSRRFYAVILSIVVMFLSDVIGVDEQEATTVVHLIAAWILGDSLSKTGRERPLRMSYQSWRDGGDNQ